jgi:hypothetical protein
MTKARAVRWNIEWQSAIAVEAAAYAAGYAEHDEKYGHSFWDYISPDERIQHKVFASKTESFKAARDRARYDFCGETRVYRQELVRQRGGHDYWRTCEYWLVYVGTKKLDWEKPDGTYRSEAA